MRWSVLEAWFVGASLLARKWMAKHLFRQQAGFHRVGDASIENAHCDAWGIKPPESGAK